MRQARGGYQPLVRRLLLLGVLSAAAAGCGGGGTTSALGTTNAVATSTASSGLSRQQFQQKANAICRSAEQDQRALGKPQNPKQLVRYLQAASVDIRMELDRLAALRPPRQDQAGFARYLQTGRQELTLVQQKLLPAAKSGNLAGVRAILRKGQQLDAGSNRIARRIGLNVCGRTTAG